MEQLDARKLGTLKEAKPPFELMLGDKLIGVVVDPALLDTMRKSSNVQQSAQFVGMITRKTSTPTDKRNAAIEELKELQARQTAQQNGDDKPARKPRAKPKARARKTAKK